MQPVVTCPFLSSPRALRLGPGVGVGSGLGPGPHSGRLDTCRRAGPYQLWEAGSRLTALCPRPHVCAERELSLVGRRQPCVRAFSRVVPVWTPGCGRQAWCVGRERRYVGPWGRGALQHRPPRSVRGHPRPHLKPLT